MSRYYFHVHHDSMIELDFVGTEFSTLDDAIADARNARLGTVALLKSPITKATSLQRRADADCRGCFAERPAWISPARAVRLRELRSA
jgi:hypothetical protein